MSEPAAKTQILIVEDERIVATSLQAQLQRLGYAVTAIASSGEEAIQKVHETRPHVILMDIVLKGPMDGIEAAWRIRKLWQIPVIYATAYGDDDTVRRATTTCPAGYLIKPFGADELVLAIESALGRVHAPGERNVG